MAQTAIMSGAIPSRNLPGDAPRAPDAGLRPAERGLAPDGKTAAIVRPAAVTGRRDPTE
jgi:hypothetical protein